MCGISSGIGIITAAAAATASISLWPWFMTDSQSVYSFSPRRLYHSLMKGCYFLSLLLLPLLHCIIVTMILVLLLLRKHAENTVSQENDLQQGCCMYHNLRMSRNPQALHDVAGWSKVVDAGDATRARQLNNGRKKATGPGVECGSRK